MTSTSNTALEMAARAGYLAKSVVYGAVGAIALHAALAAGGEAEGSAGALRVLVDQPFGQILVVLIGVGLLGYASWKVYAAATDAEAHGSEAEGLLSRGGMAVSGVIHIALALYAFTLIGGGGGSGMGTSGFGPTLSMLAGGAVGVFGLVEIFRAMTDRYVQNWQTSEMSETEKVWGKRAARLGLSARGIVFITIAILMISSGSTDAGTSEALAALSRQSFGTTLLAMVSLGLIAYAIYCAVDCRYREFRA